MINTVYNVIFLLLGVYLIYCGFIGKELSDKENLDGRSKLFISLMVNGGLIILYSTYKVYQSFKGI